MTDLADALAFPTADQPRFTGMDLISSGWLNKYVLRYTLPDGTEISYESISRKGYDAYLAELERDKTAAPHADAVSVLAITDKDEVLLIKEFRYPLNSWCVACPAGLIDDGESPARSIDRELQEETGYRVKLREDGKPLVYVLPQSGYSSNGMTEECLQVVFARVEKAGEPKTEPMEFIEAFTLPLEDVADFLQRNTMPIGSRCQLILQGLSGNVETFKARTEY